MLFRDEHRYDIEETKNRNGQESSFEQGPIRPPSEAQSLLLRVTRNCPWNQCLFCPVYKGRKFSLRTVEEIKQDIQTARDMADDIKAAVLAARAQREGGRPRGEPRFFQFRVTAIATGAIAAWLYYGTGSCFLQDADNLVMTTDDLVEVLRFLREKFPEITRVTTYSRSRTIVRKSVEALKRIREAGLDRVHVGLESGYDPVLKLVKKGVSAAQHVEAGRKILEAGMELSEYVMPGLGGQEFWREHAVATAQVLNQINPHFIRIRSLRVPERVLLHEKVRSGEFHVQTDDGVAEELKVFIETPGRDHEHGHQRPHHESPGGGHGQAPRGQGEDAGGDSEVPGTARDGAPDLPGRKKGRGVPFHGGPQAASGHLREAPGAPRGAQGPRGHGGGGEVHHGDGGSVYLMEGWMPYYPVFLDLSGKKVLVVGGRHGRRAEDRDPAGVRGRSVSVIARELTPALAMHVEKGKDPITKARNSRKAS